MVDSKITIYKSTVAALKDLKINALIDENEFEKMIGLHFVDIFKKFEIDLQDFEVFINKYKLHYFDHIDESKLYDGVIELLNHLRRNRIKISLLTTKGQDQADKIIDHFRLRNYFDYVMGRRENIAHKPSAEPLLIICDALKIQSQNTMIIGDTELDIECGKNAGAKACAVSYGYRDTKKLKSFNPDYIINDLNGLKQLFKNQKKF